VDVPEEIRRLLTGGIVDLDVFADSPVDYKLHSAKGEELHFVLPTDLPLPIGLAILGRRDAFDAVLDEDEEAIAEAWDRLLDVFAVAVAIRTPDWSGPRLVAELGQNAMMGWINIVIGRLQFQQTQLSLEDYIRSVLEPPKETSEDPKASG